jgi:hypothetical protein
MDPAPENSKHIKHIRYKGRDTTLHRSSRLKNQQRNFEGNDSLHIFLSVKKTDLNYSQLLDS